MQEAIYFGMFLSILPPITNDAVVPFGLIKHDYGVLHFH